MQHFYTITYFALTRIAIRNIDGFTIHSAISIYCERGSCHIGLFQFAKENRTDLKRTVLIIDEVSMVNGKLIDYISTPFAKLKENNSPLETFKLAVVIHVVDFAFKSNLFIFWQLLVTTSGWFLVIIRYSSIRRI